MFGMLGACASGPMFQMAACGWLVQYPAMGHGERDPAGAPQHDGSLEFLYLLEFWGGRLACLTCMPSSPLTAHTLAVIGEQVQVWLARVQCACFQQFISLLRCLRCVW
jgi:hypothetical protein